MLEKLARRAAQMRALIRAYRGCSRHVARYGRRPVVALIGARDGAAGPYRYLANRGLIDVIGFEPDEAECDRLNRMQSAGTFFPIALGDATHRQPLYLTASRGCSSCLEPNQEVIDEFPISPWFRVDKVVDVQLRRFDELYPHEVRTLPDFIQIDVQGYETRVLNGFGVHLDHVIGIQSEAHLRPLYRSQSLLGELQEMLHRRRFNLRKLRQGEYGLAGDVVEIEVWFARKYEDLNEEQRSLLSIWENLTFLPPIVGPRTRDEAIAIMALPAAQVPDAASTADKQRE